MNRWAIVLLGAALGSAAGGCVSDAERRTLRACITATTCGECMGVRPDGIECGWCQVEGAGWCMGVPGPERPATCRGEWRARVTAPQCPVIPSRTHDPNEADAPDAGGAR